MYGCMTKLSCLVCKSRCYSSPYFLRAEAYFVAATGKNRGFSRHSSAYALLASSPLVSSWVVRLMYEKSWALNFLPAMGEAYVSAALHRMYPRQCQSSLLDNHKHRSRISTSISGCIIFNLRFNWCWSTWSRTMVCISAGAWVGIETSIRSSLPSVFARPYCELIQASNRVQ